MSALRSATALLLKPVRHHGRRVAWTPEFMGLGNLLQLAMWAYDGRSRGERRWIRATPNLVPWLDVLPGLREVVLLPSEVRVSDRRVAPWSEAARSRQVDGAVAPHEPVDVAGVERFLREVVLPGSGLGDVVAGPTDPRALVVNVRRGDYYSDPEIRRQYGFNVSGYLRAAVDRSIEADGAPTQVLVVSDDVDWCRGELGWLDDRLPVEHLEASGPVSDFATVATARRMVITNSTFSYWAAHVSNATHLDNHAQVWAPRFFDRTQNGGRSWLLDERWSVVEDIPGGWELTSDGPGTGGRQ
ncbi:hypothetical protein GCM10023339_06850 [Alloalcanivorax gelatiniphagus]